jgi:hypothetical protein
MRLSADVNLGEIGWERVRINCHLKEKVVALTKASDRFLMALDGRRHKYSTLRSCDDEAAAALS